MPRKKSLTSTEIKKLIKEKELVIGTERTIKNLKLGRVEKIILSSNCAENVISDLNSYARLGNVETIRINYLNEELGVICKKLFSISVLSILKGAK
ncbi:MAG: ribosomal L7Ae/L30e/S12e/Gadd45 family protein [Candidatus Woesearchaeota archaeon]|jgi:ribosomal protein L30E|nr:ribosomal L7Ae/L30e/S12e/Gadd45 family protein [Candidatus Woesearchaeota archaeon]|tara:strand:- start:66 stop:353 length:288 start_codon:yes stop_codon:yes gene_type:complete